MAAGDWWTQFVVDRWHLLPQPTGNPSSIDQNLIGGTSAAQRTVGSLHFTGDTSIEVDAWGINSFGTPPGTLQVTAAIYALNNGITDIYPGALVRDCGTITSSAAGFQSTTFTATVLDANTAYWIMTRLVAVPAATTATLQCIDLPAFGSTYQTADTGTNLPWHIKMGWLIKDSFGTSWADPCPSGMTGGANLRINHPATWFRISNYGV